MPAHALPTPANKGSQRSLTAFQRKKGSSQVFQFQDHRPEAENQQVFQAVVDSSPQVQLAIQAQSHMGSPPTSVASHSMPATVIQQTPDEDRVREQYRYLSPEEVEKYKELARDVKQELFMNGSLNLSEDAHFSAPTEQAILEMLESSRGLHLGSNPALGQPWQTALDSYSGGKSGSALYAAIRSPHFANALQGLPVNWGGFAKPPEVHHLVYKKEEPQSAVQLWNLMLATRGSTSQQKVGQHEGMFHLVSSPPGRPGISQSVYLNEVPAVKGVIRKWAQRGLQPTISVPNSLHQPAYNVLQDTGALAFNPTGPSTLSFTSDIPFPAFEPPLSFLEQDTSWFTQPDLSFPYSFEDEHDHMDDWGVNASDDLRLFGMLGDWLHTDWDWAPSDGMLTPPDFFQDEDEPEGLEDYLDDQFPDSPRRDW